MVSTCRCVKLWSTFIWVHDQWTREWTANGKFDVFPSCSVLIVTLLLVPVSCPHAMHKSDTDRRDANCRRGKSHVRQKRGEFVAIVLGLELADEGRKCFAIKMKISLLISKEDWKYNYWTNYSLSISLSLSLPLLSRVQWREWEGR